jgi:hypothetical protein
MKIYSVTNYYPCRSAFISYLQEVHLFAESEERALEKAIPIFKKDGEDCNNFKVAELTPDENGVINKIYNSDY